MSRTRRIYNDAKRWVYTRITSIKDGYEDGLFWLRNDSYHPYRQYDHFKCNCRWCRPKTAERGSVRMRRKAYIRREISNALV